ncbi:MAG: TolC family protein [Myxococcales bacterium]|nr:TolC family protein [Myxococcales bacterium]MCB9708992.1 TolC family protein [Myxococcales bacterium]
MPQAVSLADSVAEEGPHGQASAQPPADMGPRGLTLERVLFLALRNHETPLTAKQRAIAAEARVDRALALFMPTVSLLGTYTRRAFQTERVVGGERVIIQNHNALAASGTARLSLFNARSIPLYNQAKYERDAARWSEKDARRVFLGSVAKAFLLGLGTEQVMLAARQRVGFAKENEEQAKQRAELGLVSSNDVTRAELESSAARTQLSRSIVDFKQSRLELGNLITRPVKSPLLEPVRLLEQASGVHGNPGLMIKRALSVRADLRAARSQREALKASADEPSLRVLPSLGVVGQVRATNESGISGRNVDGYVGAELSWELWDGGSRSAEEEERDALAVIGDLDVRALARQLNVEVHSALVALRQGQETEEQARMTVASARRNGQEIMELYRQGLATALLVADANVQLFEAEVAHAQAKYGVAIALIDLRQAVGLDPLGRKLL